MENRNYWEVAFSGLKRFSGEGMTLWSKEKFFLLFPSEEIATSSYVLSRLSDLESQGSISFIGVDDLYIKVLIV